jgi:uncharacterized protein YbjT (DUF2867 family)
MARVLITGGSGDLGRHVVPRVAERGHAVRVLVHKSVPPRASGQQVIEFNPGDLETGEGVGNALLRAETVVHLATDPTKTKEIDVAGTERLLREAERAGVNHFLYISIAGIDQITSYGYFRNKLEVERLIAASHLPWTILRATQFHELAVRALKNFDWLPFVLVPSNTSWQLMAAQDAAWRIAELVDAGASGRVRDIGGPEIISSEDIALAYRRTRGKNENIMRVPVPGATGSRLRAGKQLVPDGRYGRQTWQQFLVEQFGRSARKA